MGEGSLWPLGVPLHAGIPTLKKNFPAIPTRIIPFSSGRPSYSD